MCFVAAAAVVVVVVVLITVDIDILITEYLYCKGMYRAPSFQRLPLEKETRKEEKILRRPNDWLIAPHLFLVLFHFCCCRKAVLLC